VAATFGKPKNLDFGSVRDPVQSIRAGWLRLSQLLEETERFCRWPQKDVAKIVPYAQFGMKQKFATIVLVRSSFFPETNSALLS